MITTNTVSLQDIAELTGAKTGQENRWLARLVEVPRGSDFSQSSLEEEASQSGLSLTMAVQTAEAVHPLEHGQVLETGRQQSVNRALKGDRVIHPKQQGLSVAGIQSLTGAAPLVTASIGNSSPHALLAAAGTFRSSLPTLYSPDRPSAPIALAAVDIQEFEKTVHGRIPLETDQMKQARAVAKMMGKALSLAKERRAKAETMDDVPVVATAYAPTLDPQETAMASAFAAVLRPTLIKPKGGIVRIRLAKGDHKWADDPLPKYSYSKRERQCLANGVYFEARGEPSKGQQGVAQVILNRVRNPAYPNTICGVVYQNKRKRNACQFSFACDGIRDRINSAKHWRKSVKVANDAIDGRFWLRSVGSASHYHADYVWPRWRRKMRKMTKIGRHIFYRTFGGGWS
jgi:spore germination cell wall hydrolase CwlJ-like protein